ncbi:FtsB family cell division protein [Nocardioides daeguensis]|uniref:Septum formation initiator family protein n=1 Tax=Nocardioides daeguensis TaxID=908359 RepID=A0ABP6VTT1_9ACTN|nr:septum formation initiator family protein [Nocardioides daeguensis]MBV6728432.1 septum formation initiator family protein [Nocardioides daeguensis]MCR1773856.1 septum formation initiator family protein [Nocardioides daeguensis]
MADDRRTSRKPGRPASGRSGPRYAERLKAERKKAAREREAALVRARNEHQHKARLTSRAAILVLVLAVLAVSYASSLRAYLQQRSSIAALEAQISEREATIDDLRDEKKRWGDPAYVAQQARARLGYVVPGDTPFVVVDADGNPLDAGAELGDPSKVADPDKQTWYEDAWDSMKIAGNPPTRVRDPKDEIKAPKEDLEQ